MTDENRKIIEELAHEIIEEVRSASITATRDARQATLKPQPTHAGGAISILFHALSLAHVSGVELEDVNRCVKSAFAVINDHPPHVHIGRLGVSLLSHAEGLGFSADECERAALRARQ